MRAVVLTKNLTCVSDASSSPMGGGMFNNDVVGSSVIGAPLYNSNNETNPETSGWSNSVTVVCPHQNTLFIAR